MVSQMEGGSGVRSRDRLDDLEAVYRESAPRLARAIYAFAGGRRQIAEDAVAEAFARVRLCAAVDGDACEDGAIVRGIDGIGLLVNVIRAVDGPSGYEQSRVWLARVRDGVLDDLAIGDVRVVD
jgi:hypothetical protein